MHLKTSSAKWRPFCLGLNVLMDMGLVHRSEADRKQLSRMTDFIDEQLSSKS